MWSRLDELYANGITYISYNELYYWYGIDRLAKRPWRDIRGKWESLLEERNEAFSDPQVSEVSGGVCFFFSRNPFKIVRQVLNPD